MTDNSLKVDAAAQLAEHIRKKIIPSLSSRRDLIARQYAGAALARCNRLFLAIIELREAGFSDVAGLPLRPLQECWLMGFYFLLDPQEAMTVSHAKLLNQTSRFGDQWAFTDVLSQIPVEPKDTSWYKISERVNELFADEQNTTLQLFNSVYRGKSLMDIHGGLGTFGGHVTGGEVLSIREIRIEADDGASDIVMAAPLVSSLARAVAGTFGIDRSEIDRLERFFGDDS